ncbi:hypothetical protein B9G98_03708 [Wickerhamiella sorbophila]|uniref:Uncharacterized protein n=1 Tax=Wickerhamiella sorbophila TaxID=45607 RepID=A0A2T0FM75_9ASCO|nr:hypothetical protein B9G98_03708 [Wickerhamiella sorbophila]PRT56088.1 hypothetical protein B9G98_03708 [Wickerhamiella sorbophila]
MPQGKLKVSTGTGKKTKSQQQLKKGAKSFKPKRQAARKDAQIAKKHSAALTSATEKLLSSRVGHLELLKGTRREIEKSKDKKK